MKLGTCIVTNFGSYKYLEFDYGDLGLSLIHGNTGAGKSTLADIAMWALFGETAKDGASDEVRAWGSRQPTSVALFVDSLCVVRVRGNAKENDLYWNDNGDISIKHRGTDIKETQKLLNERLGIDSATFEAGSYFHEFSQTANFFTAKAKDRRALFDKLANLDLPKLLSDRTADQKKETKLVIGKKENELARLSGQIEQLTAQREGTSARVFSWKKDQTQTIKRLEQQAKTFEETKEERMTVDNINIIQANLRRDAEIENKYAEINLNAKALAAFTRMDTEQVHETCPTCLQQVYDPKVAAIRSSIDTKYNQLNKERLALLLDLKGLEAVKPKPLLVVDNTPNPYQLQLGSERTRVNPYVGMLRDAETTLKRHITDLHALENELGALAVRHSLLTRLYDLSYKLRQEMLKSAISSLERRTNELLYKHFDAEITVNFSLESLDSVEVTLQKNGFECSYKQLSRGQRSLLRLCFVVAVQEAVSNTSGVKFETLFYDEILDGLNSELKIKAFALFEELSLSHSSVILIDHDQSFQNLFDNKFEVKMVNNESSVYGI